MKTIREIILDTLTGLADDNGVIQADPATATTEIMLNCEDELNQATFSDPAELDLGATHG